MDDLNEDDDSLRGRVVLITGGSRGIGKAMAEGLARRGARIAITARRASDELSGAVAEIEAAGAGTTVLGLAADVCDFESCRKAIEETTTRFGALNCLVNNAGVGMGIIKSDYPLAPPPFWQADPAQVARMMETNATGAFNMAIAATPHLLAQRYGKIVNVSTSTVTLTLKGFFPYGPGKAALEAASAIWARDLEGTGVDVNILLPGGATDTRIIPDFPGRNERGGGIMAPEVMVPPIRWLCSAQSDGMTGGRYIAKNWDDALPLAQAAAKARSD